MANGVEVIVERVEPSGLPVERLREWLADDRGLHEVLGDVDIGSLLLSQPEILQRERKDHSPFIATAFDPQQNRAVEVSGFMDQPESLRFRPTAYRPCRLHRAQDRVGHLAGRQSVCLPGGSRGACRLSTNAAVGRS